VKQWATTSPSLPGIRRSKSCCSNNAGRALRTDSNLVGRNGAWNAPYVHRNKATEILIRSPNSACRFFSLSLRDDSRDGGGRTKFGPSREGRGEGQAAQQGSSSSTACSRQLLPALLYLPTSMWVADAVYRLHPWRRTSSAAVPDAALPPPSMESCIHAVVIPSPGGPSPFSLSQREREKGEDPYFGRGEPMRAWRALLHFGGVGERKTGGPLPVPLPLRGRGGVGVNLC
jgi:hypothetical protein